MVRVLDGTTAATLTAVCAALRAGGESPSSSSSSGPSGSVRCRMFGTARREGVCLGRDVQRPWLSGPGFLPPRSPPPAVAPSSLPKTNRQVTREGKAMPPGAGGAHSPGRASSSGRGAAGPGKDGRKEAAGAAGDAGLLRSPRMVDPELRHLVDADGSVDQLFFHLWKKNRAGHNCPGVRVPETVRGPLCAPCPVAHPDAAQPAGEAPRPRGGEPPGVPGGGALTRVRRRGRWLAGADRVQVQPAAQLVLHVRRRAHEEEEQEEHEPPEHRGEVAAEGTCRRGRPGRAGREAAAG